MQAWRVLLAKGFDMKRPPTFIECVVLCVLILVSSVIAFGLLNFIGDCAPDVANCGETSSDLSYVVLLIGLISFVYTIVYYERNKTKP